MKLVVKISAGVINEAERVANFLSAVANLSLDGHHIILLYGDRIEKIGELPDLVRNNTYNGIQGISASIPSCATKFASVLCETQYLAAGLSRHGVSALTLCGSDVGIFRLRKASHCNHNECAIEPVLADPRWLQIICSNGGIPIISNLVRSAWGQYYFIDANQMAAICAVAWQANALVYITRVDGVKETNGSVMRWLDLSKDELLETQSVISGDMLVKLKICREALERGVGRVRILPLTKVQCLQSVFDSRTEYGTEVFIRAK
jgi:acetylglutamate kinase